MITYQLISGEWQTSDDLQPPARRVHILYQRDGEWSLPAASYPRGKAEAIVNEAVAKRQTGRTIAYRFLPAAERPKMSEEVKAELRERAAEKKELRSFDSGVKRGLGMARKERREKKRGKR